MTAAIDLLIDGFNRVQQSTVAAVSGLDASTLSKRIGPHANTMAWLVWHLVRVQDDHVSNVAGHEQTWTSQGWSQEFDLPLDDEAIGYGQSSQEVGKVRNVSDKQLIGYLNDVHANTVEYIKRLKDSDLNEIVDPNWDPPVTLAVRLMSVISDDLQHAGQAAFIRGVLEHADD